ncbi:MAG TPA: NUDIX domain-containing protein [Longimicrobium sp.]|nr:NUDIX domain-containing protein [Longimicrobium sp.]
MAMSPYLRWLRERVGPARLLLPSVSAHVWDADGRLLLVRQRDMEIWSTPGGMIEPDERPADAVVREVWEETGLRVKPERIAGVYGGPECIVTYPNGDETQYVIIAFECTVTGGELRHDTDETVEVRFWSHEEAAGLPLASWLASVLPQVYARSGAVFTPPEWMPPDGQPAA